MGGLEGANQNNEAGSSSAEQPSANSTYCAHVDDSDVPYDDALSRWTLAGMGILFAWCGCLWSCNSLYQDMSRYPAADRFWCDSGRSGSSGIERNVYKSP